ncbi:hypothetical protein Ancab_013208 [Ancistrocladus abbreviatus]
MRRPGSHDRRDRAEPRLRGRQPRKEGPVRRIPGIRSPSVPAREILLLTKTVLRSQELDCWTFAEPYEAAALLHFLPI